MVQQIFKNINRLKFLYISVLVASKQASGETFGRQKSQWKGEQSGRGNKVEGFLKKYEKQAQISLYFCACCLKASIRGKLLEIEGSVEGTGCLVHTLLTQLCQQMERYPKLGRYPSSEKKSEKETNVLTHHLFSSQKSYQPFLWHFEKSHNRARQLNNLKSATSYIIVLWRYILYSCLKFDTNQICYKFVVVPLLSFSCPKFHQS